MRAFLLASVALASVAQASPDPVKDTRQIMAGTVTTTKIKNEYLSGARDGTAPFKGALAAYKAVRAAEVPVFVADPMVAPSLHGLADIASNFDTASELVDAVAPPAQVLGSSSDPQGAFRFLCGPAHVAYNDPIVYPGQPGKSHLHQFFGNTAADAYSTYASLRAKGDSTCFSKLNRSGYWIPAMLDGKGNVVRPDYVAIYYKRFPASDPRVSDPSNPEYFGKAVPLPNGLRFIFGFNMLRPSEPISTFTWFNCDGPTAKPGLYKDIPTAAANCPAGNRLGAVIAAPDCWDGKRLDSEDHHAHMAPHGVAVRTLPDGSLKAYEKCDADHPYVIPTFTLGAWYTVAPGDDPTKWSLSSDAMFPDKPAGSTFHADWFGAWDPVALKAWNDNCIDKYMSCDSGNLGNGKAMKITGFSWTADPRLVPVPPKP